MNINLIGIWTIIVREVQRTLRMSIQSLIAPWISALLYITIFGQIIGSRVTFFNGKLSYLEFVFPGILTLNLIMACFTHSSFSIYYQRFSRHIEESLAAPLSNFELIAGFVIGAIFRGILLCLGIYAIAVAFGIANVSHFWQLLFYVLSIAILFALLGIVGGLWAEGWEQVTSFEVFIITPLTFLGGMFTSLDMISLRFQTVFKLNPFFYFIDGIRYSMIDVQESNPWTRFILVISLIIVIATWVGILFKRGYKLKT
ncbi:MAG: Inner membrane transport permease YadH [Chlamydiae bacterium]|nr:Inner membrane transport permease YadH [Chlamydiota bacterium]